MCADLLKYKIIECFVNFIDLSARQMLNPLDIFIIHAFISSDEWFSAPLGEIFFWLLNNLLRHNKCVWSSLSSLNNCRIEFALDSNALSNIIATNLAILSAFWRITIINKLFETKRRIKCKCLCFAHLLPLYIFFVFVLFYACKMF